MVGLPHALLRKLMSLRFLLLVPNVQMYVDVIQRQYMNCTISILHLKTGVNLLTSPFSFQHRIGKLDSNSIGENHKIGLAEYW